MFCQGQELNLANMVSAILFQMPATVFRLCFITYMQLNAAEFGNQILRTKTKTVTNSDNRFFSFTSCFHMLAQLELEQYKKSHTASDLYVTILLLQPDNILQMRNIDYCHSLQLTKHTHRQQSTHANTTLSF